MKIKKPLSRGHRTFRRILYVMLSISFLFTAGISLSYIALRQEWVDRDVMIPYVFKTDIALQRTVAEWQGHEQRFDTATNLIRLSFASNLYREAGHDMMEDQAEDGHAPAQYTYALQLRYKFPLDENQKISKHYMQLAAAQGYEPALKVAAPSDNLRK